MLYLLIAVFAAITATAAYAAGYHRLLSRLRDWALYLYAALLGGTWFTDPAKCLGCGRWAHVMVHRPQVLAAELPGDTGYRCAGCARGARS